MAKAELQIRRHDELDTLSVDGLIEQVTLIQTAMKRVMKDGEHYGVIPGTDKPTLFKPGAEKLCMLFRFAPEYDVDTVTDRDGHFSVTVQTTLRHIPTGNAVGQGLGFCSTKESRYAYRKAERMCPVCGVAAIIKGKEQYGGGWICWKKKDGCGATFSDGDEKIEGQTTGRTPNPDLPDLYNTILKMAMKRSLVAAVLVSTAASDIFAQDLEDLPTAGGAPLVEEGVLNALFFELSELSNYAPELWAADVVLRNASQKFGRNITGLEQLTQKEAEAVLKGVRTWAKANPEPADDKGSGSVARDAQDEQDRKDNLQVIEGEVVDEEVTMPLAKFPDKTLEIGEPQVRLLISKGLLRPEGNHQFVGDDSEAALIAMIESPQTMICDFCANPKIRWQFEAKDFLMLESTHPKIDTQGSIGCWIACKECGELIRADDRNGLTERSIRIYFEKHPEQAAMMEVQIALDLMIRSLHKKFFANRTDMGTRIG